MPLGLGLSERQKTTVATAVTIVAGFVILLAVGLLLWLFGAFVTRFSSVFLPLAVAGVLAMVLKPFYELLSAKWKWPAPIALVAVFLSLLAPFALFVGVFGAEAVSQVSDLVDHVPQYWKEAREFVEERWPRVVTFFEETEQGQAVRDALEDGSGSLVKGLGSLGEHALSVGGRVLRAIGAGLNWAVFPVYLAFFLMFDPIKTDHLDDALPFLKKETRDDVVYLAGEFVNILVAFFPRTTCSCVSAGLFVCARFQSYRPSVWPDFGLDAWLSQHRALPGQHRRTWNCVAPCDVSRGWRPHARGLGACRLHHCSVHRGVPSDTKNHGRSHRSPSDGDHRGRVFLGFGAQRYCRDDPGDSAHRLWGGLLAPGEREIHQRVGLTTMIALLRTFLARLRFPQLFMVAAALLALDFIAIDPIPWVDEALLAVATLVLGSLKTRVSERASSGRATGEPGTPRPPEKNITPES